MIKGISKRIMFDLLMELAQTFSTYPNYLKP